MVFSLSRAAAWQRRAAVAFFVAVAALSAPGIARAATAALQFDGTNDYVQVPNRSGALFGSGDFSVAFWAKITSGKQGDMVTKVNAAGDTGWGFFAAVSSRLNFWTSQGSIDSGGSYADGGWHHIVGVRQGTTLRLYVDIALDASGSEPAASNVDNSQPLFIGAIPDWGSYFDGAIDEVRLYSRVLSAEEIADQFEGRFSNNSGLEGLWRFDEGAGTSVADSAGLWANGTVAGGAGWIAGISFPEPLPPGAYSYFPEATISAPKAGDVILGDVTIAYLTGDANDELGPAQYGLAPDAVSLHYSDDGKKTWKLIADKQPAKGAYVWKAENLREGQGYHVRVTVIDKVGKLGDKIAGPFRIDRTPPLFDVMVDPLVSKGEAVEITIRATESLREAPAVDVKQRGTRQERLRLSGSEALWVGEYAVDPQFEGTAVITVEGRDAAGNVGTIIRSGGFFTVGVNPPPKPLLTAPLDQEITEASPIAVRGRIREDTKAVLIVNGQRAGETAPDTDGGFVFEDVALSKTFNRGVNIIQVLSEDSAGRSSEPAVLSVKYNRPPEIALVEPKGGVVISGTAAVTISAQDENADPLAFTIEASDDNGKTWDVLVKNHDTLSFLWDTSGIADGAYLLRITADDGFGASVIVSESFGIENLLPTIAFSVPGPLTTNQDALRVEGSAASALRRGAIPPIVTVEYSIDGGQTWMEALASDGAFDGVAEPFTVELRGLTEGRMELLVRATDARGRTGKGRKAVIMDTGPPKAPIVRSPDDGAVFGNREDQDPNKGGVQVLLTGSAEPSGTVEVRIGSAVFAGRVDARGSFSFEVTLRNPGSNAIILAAIDAAGNRSLEETRLTLNHNNPPTLRFLRPREGGAIGQVYEIVFEVEDPEGNPVREASLAYRSSESRESVLLADRVVSGSYAWDVRRLREGAYEIILEASDGLSENRAAREVIVDNTPPAIAFVPLEQTVFSQTFTLEMRGSASDNLSGIEVVEYTVNDKDWFKALITSGYRGRLASFRIRHKIALEDGTYTVRFRATDGAGNVSPASPPQKILVDTTPPRIGSFIMAEKGLPLFPERGVFALVQGTTVQFTLSLERDASKASVAIGEDRIDLSEKSGLWRAEIPFTTVGEFSITISAVDAAGNKVRDFSIGKIRVVPKAIIRKHGGGGLAGVKISILQFSKEDQSFSPWQAGAWGRQNPIFSESDGSYSLFIPSGTYQMVLEKRGFQRMKTSSFTLSNPKFVAVDFTLEAQRGILRRFFR